MQRSTLSTIHIVQCAIDNPHCTMCDRQSTLYNVRSTIHNSHCTNIYTKPTIHIVQINTQSLWLLRRGLRIVAQSEPMGMQLQFSYNFSAGTSAFVYIKVSTQSPWLLRKSLRIGAQSEPMASCSFPTSPLQGLQSVCTY